MDVDQPNPIIIARDYAIMRLEHLLMLSDSDLELCTETELTSISDGFHEAQIKLFATVPRGTHKEEFNVTSMFEAKLRSLKARIRNAQQVSVKLNTSIAPQSSNLPKLPKISIKQFDGKIENWISFIQLFNSLVHERSDLSDVEKLHYLLSSVLNEAYNLIKNYPVTNKNYKVAYDALYKHYNKTRQIATAYYERLVNCEPVKTSRSSDLERVHRTFTENLAILESFDLPDENFMLFQLLWSKLDKSTKEQFELEHNSDEIPEYEAVQKFIEKRFRALDAAGSSVSSIHNVTASSSKTSKPKTALVVASTQCILCKAPHSLLNCPIFLKFDPDTRFKCIKENRLCILCLSGTHSVKLCKSKQRCEYCNFSHNTLLHFNKPAQAPSETSTEVFKPAPDPSKPMALVANNIFTSSLFSTAKVLVRDHKGDLVPVRVLLDCASACNFITESCAKKLGLAVKSGSHSVNGIGQAVAAPAGTLSCTISPSTGELKNTFSLEAYTLPTICSDMPTEHIDMSSWHHMKDLGFADPCLHKPGPIDMLFSVDVFASSLRPGLIHGEPGQPTAVNTIFGWILMGSCATHECRSRSRDSCHVITNSFSLDDSIKRFWELEQVNSPSTVILSKEDQLCEQYFVANFSRTEECRFIVPLPFAESSNKPSFVGSRAIALKRFSSLERKLQGNPELSTNYVAFMEDYEKCHHLERCDPPAADEGHFYYIPHHGVIRPHSTSTPLRVVFDASAKDAQGIPDDLVGRSCWWNGPSWLSLPTENWPRSTVSVDVDLLHDEQRLTTLLVPAVNEDVVERLLTKYSSLRTLKHVLAYCFRFAHNARNCKIPEKMLTGHLTPVEIKHALMFLVRFAQEHCFSSEIDKIKKKVPNSLPKSFRKLSPFLDDAGLLRVGGRLARASLDFDVKHPLLLPREHRLTVLLIYDYHHRFMHPGIQTLHNLLAQHFWILSPKRAIGTVVSKCMKCFRVRPTGAPAPFMGQLPSYRINQLKPFSSAAVDFGGPFDISLGRGRGNKTYKAYICIFVCTSTKAIHAELATELSSEAFLAAL